MKCSGCGVSLHQGQACYETACNDFWCTGCCQPAVWLVDHALIGGEVMERTEAGYDYPSN